MARIYVALGSNIDRQRNITSALDCLTERFGCLSVSNVYATKACGMVGDEFYNLVVGFDCDDDVETIVDSLKSIESAHGRHAAHSYDISGILDLDLLTYAARVVHDEKISIPRDDIVNHAFVLKPLADIAPETRHPLTGTTYQAMWDAFADKSAILRDVSDLFG
jgi:2-amino-4-hydroxy-6-hydroxymethyldihydropteridine diphosphokinase